MRPIDEFNNKIQGTFYVPELLKIVSDEKDENLKIRYIQNYMKKSKNHQKALRGAFECIWHPRIEFDLPEGRPEIRMENPVYDKAPNNLFNIIQYVPYLAKSNLTIKNEVKRQNLFIQLCESIHDEEAELLIMMKDKYLDMNKYPGITPEIVLKAIPGCFPESAVKTQEERVREEVERENAQRKKEQEGNGQEKRRVGRPPKEQSDGDSSTGSPKESQKSETRSRGQRSRSRKESGTTKGKKMMNDGTTEKFVPKNEVKEWTKAGWTLGKITKA